jgi:hypothetical protein
MNRGATGGDELDMHFRFQPHGDREVGDNR